jgi:hypothetical protein
MRSGATGPGRLAPRQTHVGRRFYTDRVESMHPWPPLAEEDQWLIGLMEELLADGFHTPDELRARAKELREEARGERFEDGYLHAVLALADRYEAAAAARAGAR